MGVVLPRFDGHTQRQTNGLRALRLEMKEISGIENRSIDLAVKSVVQSSRSRSEKLNRRI
jgi:hypothetical protein